MSEAGDFIDAALQHEVSPYAYSAIDDDGLLHYGTSVGAIRATVGNALRRYAGLGVGVLVANDLTRLEGFLRSAGSERLARQLATDVIEPMIAGLGALDHARAIVVVARWASDPNEMLRMIAASAQFERGVT